MSSGGSSSERQLSRGSSLSQLTSLSEALSTVNTSTAGLLVEVNELSDLQLDNCLKEMTDLVLTAKLETDLMEKWANTLGLQEGQSVDESRVSELTEPITHCSRRPHSDHFSTDNTKATGGKSATGGDSRVSRGLRTSLKNSVVSSNSSMTDSSPSRLLEVGESGKSRSVVGSLATVSRRSDSLVVASNVMGRQRLSERQRLAMATRAFKEAEERTVAQQREDCNEMERLRMIGLERRLRLQELEKRQLHLELHAQHEWSLGNLQTWLRLEHRSEQRIGQRLESRIGVVQARIQRERRLRAQQRVQMDGEEAKNLELLTMQHRDAAKRHETTCHTLTTTANRLTKLRKTCNDQQQLLNTLSVQKQALHKQKQDLLERIMKKGRENATVTM